MGVSNLFLNEVTHVSKHFEVKYKRSDYESIYILMLKLIKVFLYYLFCDAN